MEKTTIDYSWQAHANCTELSPTDFYLAHGKKYSQKVIDACKNCIVQEDCLSHALKYEEYGYWGGTTSKQRVSLRKALGIVVQDICYESEKAAEQDAVKIEETRVKIKGRGRKPRNLQLEPVYDTF